MATTLVNCKQQLSCLETRQMEINNLISKLIDAPVIVDKPVQKTVKANKDSQRGNTKRGTELLKKKKIKEKVFKRSVHTKIPKNRAVFKTLHASKRMGSINDFKSFRSNKDKDAERSKTLNAKFDKEDRSQSKLSSLHKKSVSIAHKHSSQQSNKIKELLNKNDFVKKALKSSRIKERSNSHYYITSRISNPNKSVTKAENSLSKTGNNFFKAKKNIPKKSFTKNIKKSDYSSLMKIKKKSFLDIKQDIKKPHTRYKSALKRIHNIKDESVPSARRSEKQSRKVNKSVQFKPIDLDKKYMLTDKLDKKLEESVIEKQSGIINEKSLNKTINISESDLQSSRKRQKTSFHQKTPSFKNRRPFSSFQTGSNSSNFMKKKSIKKIVRMSKDTSPYNFPKMNTTQTSNKSMLKGKKSRKSNCMNSSNISEVKEETLPQKFVFESSLRNNSSQDKKLEKDLQHLKQMPHKRYYPQFDQFYFNNKVL